MNTSGMPPLDMDLAQMDTSRSLLKNGHYDLSIRKVEEVKTRNGQRMLKLEQVTVDPAVSVKEEPLQPGQVVVFHNLVLEPSGKSDWNLVCRNIAELIQAAGLSGVTVANITNPADLWYQQLVGRTVRASITYVPEGTDPRTGKSFKAKNEVSSYLKA